MWELIAPGSMCSPVELRGAVGSAVARRAPRREAVKAPLESRDGATETAAVRSMLPRGAFFENTVCPA